jgi:hypothetical protein
VFRHWAVYDLPPEYTALPEAIGKGPVPVRLEQGVNDFGPARYDGPCPPAGHGTHHYHFRLAALDAQRLELPPRAKVADIWRTARPHILAETELVGTYAR